MKNDVFVRLSLRYSWCNSFLFFLNMSSWPRCLSRCCSRCSWALTGPRGSIGSDTALSDTDYDRTAEQRLTPPLASHQQRCHITPESRSDKSSATDGQVRRSLRSWCWRATDCSIRFVLSSSLYVVIFFSIDRNCFPCRLSYPISSCSMLYVDIIFAKLNCFHFATTCHWLC